MKQRLATIVGVLAMVLLVIGVFLPAGSLAQKILFVIGAPTLYWVAMVNQQTIFIALQLVVTLGAVLAFVPQMPGLFRYLIMLLAVGIAIKWVGRVMGFKRLGVNWMGLLGLSLIAIGLATPAALYPVPFFASLGVGGLLVAVTAGFSIAGGFRLGWIWLILNLLFAYSPLLQLVRIIK